MSSATQESRWRKASHSHCTFSCFLPWFIPSFTFKKCTRKCLFLEDFNSFRNLEEKSLNFAQEHFSACYFIFLLWRLERIALMKSREINYLVYREIITWRGCDVLFEANRKAPRGSGITNKQGLRSESESLIRDNSGATIREHGSRLPKDVSSVK